MGGETFKTERAAAKKLALALGIKGAAGGWIYKPPIEHLPLSGSGTVPLAWGGHQLYQGWDRFEYYHGARIVETADGRFAVSGAAALYEDAKQRSSACYAQLLDALANGDDDAAAKLKARHEGWKLRVFAAYDLAFGKTTR